MSKTVKIVNTIKVILIISVIFSMQRVSLFSSNSKVANENLNKTMDLNAMAVKFDEIQKNDKYSPLDTFTGDLTGYAADCPLCGGTLGCTGQNVLINRITTYNDKDYGEVKIVASSKNLKCGSIITFDAGYISDEKVTAIVLDRGVLGTDIDLLVESEEFALKNVGRHKITYDVLRNGWERQVD